MPELNATEFNLPRFNGGYTVQTYGSHKAEGIDAVQFEYGSNFRAADKLDDTAKRTAAAIKSFLSGLLAEACYSGGARTRDGQNKRRSRSVTGNHQATRHYIRKLTQNRTNIEPLVPIARHPGNRFGRSPESRLVTVQRRPFLLLPAAKMGSIMPKPTPLRRLGQISWHRPSSHRAAVVVTVGHRAFELTVEAEVERRRPHIHPASGTFVSKKT